MERNTNNPCKITQKTSLPFFLRLCASRPGSRGGSALGAHCKKAVVKKLTATYLPAGLPQLQNLH